MEIKFLKDKMKLFEGTVTQTQFNNGFGGFKNMQNQTTGFIQTQQHSNNQVDTEAKLV